MMYLLPIVTYYYYCVLNNFISYLYTVILINLSQTKRVNPKYLNKNKNVVPVEFT